MRSFVFSKIMSASILCVILSGCQQSSTAPAKSEDFDGPEFISDSELAAFVNVTIVSPSEGRAIQNQTVMTQNGKIISVGNASGTQIPQRALVIDGEGRYLMPGLADMHVHLLPYEDVKNDLLLFLANGVTTIRVMWGNTAYLNWRQQISDGDLLGPTIYSASPGMDGPPNYWPTDPIATPEEGRVAVQNYAAQGFNFIKVYNRLSPQTYSAIAQEANNHNLPVIGHIPNAVGLSSAIDQGQDCIEHLSGYAPFVSSNNSWSSGFNDSAARNLARRLRDNQVWSCPTQVVIERSRNDIQAQKSSLAWRYLSQSMKDWFDNSLTQPGGFPGNDYMRNRARMIKLINDEGAGLILGTDTGVQYVLPGFSVHEELQSWVDMGISTTDVLRSATTSAAAFVNAVNKFAEIKPELRADLVLLSGNPLEEIANASTPLGVMVQGRWFSNMKLTSMMEENIAE